MQCSKCRNDGIIFQQYSGQTLCRDHFIADFEAKAKRAIRVHRWMQPHDHIVVALTGNSGDEALLFFFRKLTGNRRDIRISGIPVTGERARMVEAARNSGGTKIALAASREDLSASLLTSILKGDAEQCFADIATHEGDLPLINPFCHIPSEEVALYARIHGIAGEIVKNVRENDLLFTDVKAMLTDYTSRHPATPHAILNLCETLKQTGRPFNPGRPHGA